MDSQWRERRGSAKAVDAAERSGSERREVVQLKTNLASVDVDQQLELLKPNPPTLLALPQATAQSVVQRKDAVQFSDDPPLETDILPFTEDGWNANTILKNLGQIENDELTTNDAKRCAPTSLLAAHVMVGPQAVAATARKTWAEMEGSDDPNVEALKPTIAGLADRIISKEATYRDLGRLASVMLWITVPGGGGVDAGSTGDMQPVSAGKIQQLNERVQGFDAFSNKVSALQSSTAYLVATYKGGIEFHTILAGSNTKDRDYLYDPAVGKNKLLHFDKEKSRGYIKERYFDYDTSEVILQALVTFPEEELSEGHMETVIKSA